MLRIKENVDLKVLENYGFEIRPDKEKEYCYIGGIEAVKELYRDEDDDAEIFIAVVEREVRIYVETFYKDYSLIGNVDETIELDTLFDLIKDGIIEKI